jgi:hypothetical protein
VVAVALANKTARIAWAVMHRHETSGTLLRLHLVACSQTRPQDVFPCGS